MPRDILTLAVALGLVGCGAATQEPQQFPDANDPAYAASFDGERDERVSTSAGEEGGVVVLFPRVIPAEGAETVASEASAIQARLRELAERALPGRPLDVRPAPQRTCPSAGCRGVSVGAVLLHRERGCAVVATVSRPGQSSMRLVAWTQSAQLRSAVVPYREYPESQVGVRDYTPCADLGSAMAERDEAVVEAITAIAGELPETEAAPDSEDAPSEAEL